MRSAESVVDEIRYLWTRYNIRGISFRDPNLTFDKQRAHEFADLLLKYNLDIRWSMEARTDRLDPELIELLYRAGLRSVEVGVESANAETLRRNQRKAISHSQQERIIECCHKRGFVSLRIIRSDCPMIRLRESGKPSGTQEAEYVCNPVHSDYAVSGHAFYEKVRNTIFEKNWSDLTGGRAFSGIRQSVRRNCTGCASMPMFPIIFARAMSGDFCNQPFYTRFFSRIHSRPRTDRLRQRWSLPARPGGTVRAPSGPGP
jgi:hypothetical protein